MEYGKAFTFITEDKDWVSKALMGVVFTVLIPVFGIGLILLAGWAIAIARGVIRGQAEPLPDWSEFGQMFVDGLKGFIVVIVWYIPLWVLSLLSALIGNDAFSILVGLCSFVYGIAVGLLFLGVFGLIADDRPFGEVINPANSWEVVSANLGDSIITWILILIGVSVSAMIGIILCVIGILLGIPYGYALSGHLYGQLYRQARGGKAAAV